MPDNDALLNIERLTQWCDEHLPQLGDGPLTAQWLHGGATNAVFRIDRGGRAMVLRRPPASPRPDSARIMEREAQVLRALNGTGVPAPRFFEWCGDQDVTGAVFYVMEMVDGWNYNSKRPSPAPYDKPGPERRALGFAMIGGIAQLARVDYRAVGLEGFGKPERFLERQVDRWSAQLASYVELEDYEGRPLPGLDYVKDWLRANTPEMSPPAIIHGDYGFANCLLGHGTPPRLAAMIDWELATVGDPLLDLGWVVYGFQGRDDDFVPAGYVDPRDFPYREELVEHYEEVSGRKAQNLTYYMILAQFKLATLLERHYARGLNGKSAREVGDNMGAIVLRLLTAAENMARRAG